LSAANRSNTEKADIPTRGEVCPSLSEIKICRFPLSDSPPIYQPKKNTCREKESNINPKEILL
jgi:hypothetical protein